VIVRFVDISETVTITDYTLFSSLHKGHNLHHRELVDHYPISLSQLYSNTFLV